MSPVQKREWPALQYPPSSHILPPSVVGNASPAIAGASSLGVDDDDEECAEDELGLLCAAPAKGSACFALAVATAQLLEKHKTDKSSHAGLILVMRA